MSNSLISAIIICGHYSAGKGPVARVLQDIIQRDFPHLDCSFIRDRDLLDKAVLKDTARTHSIIRDYGPPLVFDVKSGFLHDRIHRSMIEGIRYIPAGQLQLLEIATGPDVRDFGLWQSGDHLVTLVNEYDIYDKTLFVEVHASEATRFRRNQQRDDFVSEEIMRVAACAGGELFHVADVLGDHYWQINNEADGEIYHLADQAYTNFIRPHLYTDHNTIEYGSAQARERHDR